ncbi:MAG TPA: MBL fold metallo-hydrolase [Allosphingosinicella sp.]|nr:MBL fold metallo-hydrolase [Allosphingosinicella sp.]
MRLRTFKASDGDSLLLSSSDNHHMLVDGGRSETFREHVAQSVSDCKTLDVLCISHIDADHITGVLELLDVEVDWRVHLAEASKPPTGRRPFPQPSSPKPPRILQVWHNGFGDQLSTVAGDVRSMLSLAASSQLSLANPDAIPRHNYLADLALGEKQAITLTHRLGAAQLGIPLNKQFGGKLIRAGMAKSTFKLGKTTLTVLGPFQEDLDSLQTQWREWLAANTKAIEDVREEMDRDAGRLQLGEGDIFLRTMEGIAQSTGKLGKRESVTTPNLASIIILAAENKRTVLLTGDAAGQDIVKGLEQARKLDSQGCIHVDVLKVQHHGAGANISEEFVKAVTADHYVFCGNGSHSNPEEAVLRLIAESRLDPAKRSPHAKAGAPFEMHFNHTSTDPNTTTRKGHMKKIETLMATLAAGSGGQMKATFHATSFFDIDL